ncbi:MAG: hypothetical protein GY862_10265, partial [Gammaproteobacteria bacterium]|nr:hypothetical protein [Gammaproteobacteria bacterium]
MIDSLVAALHRTHLEPTAKELADALWLATYLDSSKASKKANARHSAASGPAPPSSPAQEKNASPEAAPEAESETSKSESTPIYSSTEAKTKKQGAGRRPFKVPAAASLPGMLDIARALHPLMGRVPSRTEFVLDVEATVNNVAESGIWRPVLQGVPERRFDVALIVEQCLSMLVWQQTIAELRGLLERYGAFRDVQTWGLAEDSGKIRLCTDRGYARFYNPRELVETNRRRLILIASDCVSPAWRSGAMAKLLNLWKQNNLVTIVQMLPRRLWSNTGLADAVIMDAYATGTVLPNIQVKSTVFSPKADEKTAKIPLVTLERESLTAWARAVAGRSGAATPCVALKLHGSGDRQPEPFYTAKADLPSTQRLEHFRASASSMARKLAEYLAATPLTIPIMRLVQQTMLPDSRQIHLAEVLLGGLLREPAGTRKSDPASLKYDFHLGVRSLLLDAVPAGDMLRIRKAVSDYLASRLDRGLNFSVLLADLSITDGAKLDVQSQYFATLETGRLHKLGRLAKRMEQHMAVKPPVIDDSLFKEERIVPGGSFIQRLRRVAQKVTTLAAKTLRRLEENYEHFANGVEQSLDRIDAILREDVTTTWERLDQRIRRITVTMLTRLKVLEQKAGQDAKSSDPQNIEQINEEIEKLESELAQMETFEKEQEAPQSSLDELLDHEKIKEFEAELARMDTADTPELAQLSEAEREKEIARQRALEEEAKELEVELDSIMYSRITPEEVKKFNAELEKIENFEELDFTPVAEEKNDFSEHRDLEEAAKLEVELDEIMRHEPDAAELEQFYTELGQTDNAGTQELQQETATLKKFEAELKKTPQTEALGYVICLMFNPKSPR